MPNFTLNQSASLLNDTFVLQLFGSEILTGMFILGFFAVVLLKSHASVDLYPVVLLPLIAVLAKFGYLPVSLAGGIWLIAGVVLYLAVKKMMVGQQ